MHESAATGLSGRTAGTSFQFAGKTSDPDAPVSRACRNERRRGVRDKPKVKRSNCPNQPLPSLGDEVVERHLRGANSGGTPFVIGDYPMLTDDGCSFITDIQAGIRPKGYRRSNREG
jgi:hypothetical protein